MDCFSWLLAAGPPATVPGHRHSDMSTLELTCAAPHPGGQTLPVASRSPARPPASPHNRASFLAAPSDAACDIGTTGLSLSSPALPATSSDSEFETRVAPLWRQAQEGHEAAYREALRLIALRVRAYLRRRLQSTPDEVEDLVQEVLLALHLQRGSWNPTTCVEAWVLAIARYKLVDLWRRRGRQDALHDPIDDMAESALAAPEVDASAGRDLARLLERLPPAQREAIVLTKVEGLSVSEACARTGASESALKVQVHRGLKRLAALVRRPT